MANVTSAIDTSIDNNDNDKKQLMTSFFVVNPGDHKVVGRINRANTFFSLAAIEIQRL